jgi:two-component system OmpR family response regulator
MFGIMSTVRHEFAADAREQATSEKSTQAAILVVDDEANFVVLLDRVLSKRGYAVWTALNGEEALRLAKNTGFELAVLDIRMGPMDGLALLSELKRSAPDMKIIVMTAFPTYETRLTSFRRGASAYVTKPVNLSGLVDTIGRLVKDQ